MREKKAIYIIPEVDMNKEPIPIPNDDVRSYKIDLENKKNTLNDKGGVEAYALPEEGKMRPVFYIQKGGRLYFGYTPRLRLLYDHSVKEGVPQIHAPKKTEEIKIDFAKAMFGYSNQNGNAYRSKLSFTDAVVRESENVKPGAEQRVILSSPKPTSCLDYICTDDKGNPRSYNANKFELRGVKQYWIRENAVPSDEKKAEQGKVDKVSSVLRPLAEKTVFKGTVRFQNLTQKELGLLLWSIRLNKDSWMNIGKAKAYGYGTVAVQITGARKICISKAYSLDGTLNLKPYEDIDVDAAINHYKIEMNQWLKKEKSSLSIEEQPSVSDFLRMKDSKNIPGDNDIRYMRIGSKKNEYQKRTKTLPSVKEVQEKRSSKKKGD
jgi:CRISPR-associated protein (TIGR03986 family)